jgi:hypothetical protein
MTEVVVTGKRERKQAEVYKAPEEKQKKEFAIAKGTGSELGKLGYFCKGLEKLKSDDDLTKILYSLLFSSISKKADAKKHVRLHLLDKKLMSTASFIAS